MTRDNVEVPPIMEKCCQAIEKYGIESQGIYRLSGTVTKVANLRQRLDKGNFGLRGRVRFDSFSSLSRYGLGRSRRSGMVI